MASLSKVATAREGVTGVPGEDPTDLAVLRLALSPTPIYDEQLAVLRWVAVAVSSRGDPPV